MKLERRALHVSKEGILKIINPLVAVTIAFLFGGMMVLISGDSPLETYGIILNGAFGSAKSIHNTIRYAIPILMLAYSFAICNKCGYFNISQEAQIYAAAIAIAMVSQATLALPTWLRMVLMILASCVTATLFCLLPAFVHHRFGVSDVVIGVMLNYLMQLLLQHLLKFSFIGDQSKSTLMSKPLGGEISQGVLMALCVILIVGYQFVLKWTIPGYRLTIVGKNPKFAQASGLPSQKIIYLSAVVGGLLAGMVACGELFANYSVIYANFASDFGFNGMTAALIGGSHPVGMLFGSVLLGALRSGSTMLDVFSKVPASIVDCVQGFVTFLASIAIFKVSKKKRAGLKQGGAKK